VVGVWHAPGVSSPDELAAFAGQVSHDLKNPLAAIGMSLEMASEEAGSLDPDGSVLASLLDRAAGAADRMRDMIDALHDYAIAGTGLAPDRVDLAELVADLAPTARASALPTVTADPDQMRMLLANLLGNATQFAREGGTSTVAVDAARIGDRWRVEVVDDGRGIPADDRERVFEPMVRLDKTVPGTGVGLSTCKRIVEAHGGTIGLAAAPGGGTVAWFELPDAASAP
jgi:signal transduction histidine kinase